MTDKSPVDFFQLLIPDDLFQVVVDETNRFAQQYMNATELTCFSRVCVWEKTAHTLAEMKKFLAIVITMGFVVLPQIEDGWSTKWPFAMTTFSSIHRGYWFGDETGCMHAYKIKKRRRLQWTAAGQCWE